MPQRGIHKMRLVDIYGEGARNLLAALADCNDKLRMSAYQLYLQHIENGSQWNQSFVISGKPFTIHNEVYERCFRPSVNLLLPDLKASIAFNIYLCWNSDIWLIESGVELYDKNDDIAVVWTSPTKRTQDLDEAISHLIDVTQQMIQYGEATDFTQLLDQ